MPGEMVDNGVPAGAGPTAVCLHGIGLGPWFWEPWWPCFAERGIRAVALRMPGHGDGRVDISLAETLAGVRGALAEIPGPIALVGHSMGGLVAQLLAAEQEFAAVALVCPLPPRQVRVPVTRALARGAIPLLPALIAGRPVPIPYAGYRRLGFARLTEADARAAWERTLPWPNRLCRELLRPPEVAAERVRSPVLVALGLHDQLVPWQSARVLGDLYEAVVWRYDDLGHNPPLEPGGMRMGRDVAGFIAEPVRPKVIESEGFAPDEGIGHERRRARRGEAMKRRSAYGQKPSGR